MNKEDFEVLRRFDLGKLNEIYEEGLYDKLQMCIEIKQQQENYLVKINNRQNGISSGGSSSSEFGYRMDSIKEMCNEKENITSTNDFVPNSHSKKEFPKIKNYDKADESFDPTFNPNFGSYSDGSQLNIYNNHSSNKIPSSNLDLIRSNSNRINTIGSKIDWLKNRVWSNSNIDVSLYRDSKVVGTMIENQNNKLGDTYKNKNNFDLLYKKKWKKLTRSYKFIIFKISQILIMITLYLFFLMDLEYDTYGVQNRLGAQFFNLIAFFFFIELDLTSQFRVNTKLLKSD